MTLVLSGSRPFPFPSSTSRTAPSENWLFKHVKTKTQIICVETAQMISDFDLHVASLKFLAFFNSYTGQFVSGSPTTRRLSSVCLLDTAYDSD